MADELYAGIDIGGTKISVLITDAEGNVRGRSKKKSKPERGFEAVMGRAADCVHEACDAAGIDLDDLVAAGVGAPSPILPDGTAIAAPNMGWENAPLATTLKKHLKETEAALEVAPDTSELEGKLEESDKLVRTLRSEVKKFKGKVEDAKGVEKDLMAVVDYTESARHSVWRPNTVNATCYREALAALMSTAESYHTEGVLSTPVQEMRKCAQPG